MIPAPTMFGRVRSLTAFVCPLDGTTFNQGLHSGRHTMRCLWVVRLMTRGLGTFYQLQFSSMFLSSHG